MPQRFTPIALCWLFLLLLPITIDAQIGRTQALVIHPDYSTAESLRIVSVPGNEAAVARLELALLNAGIPVLADDRIRTNLTTATTQIRVADTTFSRPYREPIGIELFSPKPSQYVATVSGDFTAVRYLPLATRLEIRIIDTSTGQLLTVYHFQQRCNLQSESLSDTMRRFAEALAQAPLQLPD